MLISPVSLLKYFGNSNKIKVAYVSQFYRAAGSIENVVNQTDLKVMWDQKCDKSKLDRHYVVYSSSPGKRTGMGSWIFPRALTKRLFKSKGFCFSNTD